MTANVHKLLHDHHALLFSSAMAEHRAAIALRAKGRHADAAVAEAAASAYAYALKKHQEAFATLTGDPVRPPRDDAPEVAASSGPEAAAPTRDAA